MKKCIFIGLFAVFTLLLTQGVLASNVRLIIDNQEITGLPAPPIIRNDSVLVPARAVFERMGGEVGWHHGNRQVTVLHGTNVLVMTIDSTIAMLNGSPITLATPPIIMNDSTLIPLRPAELLGFEVFWDNGRRAAVINSNGNGTTSVPSPPPPPGGEVGAPPIIPPPAEPPTIPPPVTEPPTTPPETTTAPPPATTQPQGPPTIIAPPSGEDVADDKLVDEREVTTELAHNISTTSITAMEHPQTNLTGVLGPGQTGSASYRVVASSPISNVTYFVLSDNRLVITIHNAANMFSGNISTHPSVPISGVRMVQYTTTPMVSRIVFDVVGAAPFSLSLSENRHELNISFAQNKISNVQANVGNGVDTIRIQGNQAPAMRISTEGYPHFFTILVDNATMQAPSGTVNGGNFATHFTTGQRSLGLGHINVYVGDTWPSFSVTQGSNYAVLTMHHNISGIRYDSLRRELHIDRSTGFTMDVANVRHIDRYLNLEYTLELRAPGAMLGRGELSIMDGLINAVTLDADMMGNVRLTFDTQQVLVFSVHETPTSYVIRANLPREVSPFVVVIDPGHGGRDPGTQHNGLCEYRLVLEISNKVMELLNANPNIRAYMTRHDNTTTVLNRNRALFANELGADLFVSVHANAAEHSPGVINPNARGIETLYSLNDTGHRFNGRQFAEIAQRHMVNRTGAVSRDLLYRPNVVIFRYTTMPSVLLEVGFLTNPQEAALLATSQYQWQLAQAIYDAIVEAFTRFPPQR